MSHFPALACWKNEFCSDKTIHHKKDTELTEENT